jgi:hypothetical protein
MENIINKVIEWNGRSYRSTRTFPSFLRPMVNIVDTKTNESSTISQEDFLYLLKKTKKGKKPKVKQSKVINELDLKLAKYEKEQKEYAKKLDRMQKQIQSYKKKLAKDDKPDKAYNKITYKAFNAGILKANKVPKDILQNVEVGKFKNIAQAYFVTPDDGFNLDTLVFFNEKRDMIHAIIKLALATYRGIKVNFNLHCIMKEPNGRLANAYFRSTDGGFHTSIQIMSNSQITSAITTMTKRVEDVLDTFTQMKSGWVLSEIKGLYINIVLSNLTGKSYIDLPYELKNKKACINVKNDDNECFKWAILSCLHPIHKNSDRVSSYKKFEKELCFDGIDFPVKVNDDVYKKFEKLNKTIRLNVLMYDNKKKDTFPKYKSDKEDGTLVNLLLIEKEGEYHYVWIKNFSGLLGHANNKYYYCYSCLWKSRDEEQLKNHLEFGCSPNGPAKMVLPSKEEADIKFTNIQKQFKHPIVIYADFEAITASDDQRTKKTMKYQQHIGCSYGYKVVSQYSQWEYPYKFYRGEDAILNFLKSIKTLYWDLLKQLKTNIELVMTEQNEKDFQSSVNCHICSKVMGKDRVRDHDHYTGIFRGAAHEQCNINYCLKGATPKIPVVFHNLRGYDSHLIMQEIGKVSDRVDCIPNNQEKYVCFWMDNYVFIDSYQFLLTSLESAAEKLTEFPQLKKEFNECVLQKEYDIDVKHKPSFEKVIKQFRDRKFNLLTKKGVYPYDYMNSMERFDDSSLPSKKDFYSQLNDSDITDDNYSHAQKVWTLFNCKSMGDYHDLYLKTDVMILADVFENFRSTSLKNYGLDPVHYFTAPSLSWDGAFKTTNAIISNFNDKQMDMLLMTERGTRGGISVISNRFAKANNKYMKNHDKSKPSSYIVYLDCNNLYGASMSMNLPTGNYKWENVDEFTSDKIKSMDFDGEKGYMFEVDLLYPKELHELHNDYPLAPESIVGKLSPFMKDFKQKHDIGYTQTNKLIPNLNDKKKYVVHCKNLQFYLKQGLVLEKVHRIMSFSQSKWLKEYIDFNTGQRAKATTDFEKDFFKLMNNSVFGKTMENVRNHVDVKLRTSQKRAQRLFNKPNFKHSTTFNKDLIAVELKKMEVLFNKPIAVGFCILELSKIIMYDFHYNYIKQKYGNMATLLFTDTDSLTYHIETEDLYKDMEKDSNLFDFSEYPEKHFLHSKVNKKVVGKFKDEAKSKIIIEFAGLRSKMYSILYDQDDEIDTDEYKTCVINGNLHENKITAKGVKKSYAEKRITHENYRQALFSTDTKEVKQEATFNLIRSTNHQISSIKITKTSLCALDDKRLVCRDNIKTFAIGHYNPTNL